MIFRCSVEVESGRVFGIESDNEGKDQRPLILSPVNPSACPLLQLEFVLFPSNRQSDYQFHLTMEPIHLFYHAVRSFSFLSIVSMFFAFQPSFNQLVENFEANGPLMWQSQFQ